MIRLGLLLLSLSLTGCASKSLTLYPIQQKDIAPLAKDQDFKAPEQGWFLSDFYMEEVMKAKVK